MVVTLPFVYRKSFFSFRLRACVGERITSHKCQGGRVREESQSAGGHGSRVERAIGSVKGQYSVLGWQWVWAVVPVAVTCSLAGLLMYGWLGLRCVFYF